MKKNKIIRLAVIIGIGIAVFFFYFLLIDLLLNKFFSVLKKEPNYNFLTSLEDRSLDLFLNFKSRISRKTFTETYSKREINKNVSNNIMIIGIDDKSLNFIGKWPFKRSVHSKIVNYFTNSEFRESVLFFDVFFLEDDYDPQEDQIFIDSIKKNKNVVFDYIAREKSFDNKIEKDEMQKRIAFIKDKFGILNNIKGTVQDAVSYMAITPPTMKYMESLSQIGCANIKEDSDRILRRYSLVLKYINREEIFFKNLQQNDKVDKIYLLNHVISFNKKRNEYSLKRNETNIFDITETNYAERKVLSENGIDKLNETITDVEHNFNIEINHLKELIEKNNDNIIAKIEQYFKKSKIQQSLKNEILLLITNKEYFNNIDLIIKEIISQLSKNENRFKKEIAFLNKMYQKLIKVNRGEAIKIINESDLEEISLFDYLYKNKEVDFNKLLIFKESFFMSIPLVILSKYFNVNTNDIEVNYGKEILLKNPKIYNQEKKHFEKLKINNIEQEFIKIPIDKNGNLLIDFVGPRSSSNRNESTTFDVFSYSDFISGKQFLIKDKIAMVGAFAAGVADDEYLTPFGNMYGIEIIANTLNTVIKRNYIGKLNKYFYLLILFFFSIIIALISSNKKIIRAYIFSLLFVFIYYLFAIFLFINSNIVLEVPKVIIISLFSLMSVIVYRVLTEEKQKKKIKDIFSRYVNPQVVEELLESPPELGGVDKNITVFFSDIRDFTSLSERLSPQTVITHLNKYFTAMTEIIFKYDGTLDKYVGDEIMCFWGAPKPQKNHAELACRAALDQMKKLEELNKKWEKSMRINIGIGINTGIMTVGNVGSEGRMDYTIIGDNVNLGARLEGVNKTFGTNIIVSETTYKLVKDKFNFKELDTIKVKGKEKPVKIYELIEAKE
jgi:class 3 adenylate cyclase/CHASE2 domain-containing sensor protein